jgi:hypothetical protein
MNSVRRQRSIQWGGQFLVAAELERHGYDVSFTMGNHTPVADLMVGHSQTGIQFWVDVKAQRPETSWWGKPKEQRLNLFYVLVRVGPTRADDRFFILSQQEFNDLVKAYCDAHPNNGLNGFGWKDALPFEGSWTRLPSW